MKVIGNGLCRNAGIKKGQLVHGDYHHKVELTERDSLLLEKALINLPVFTGHNEDSVAKLHRIDHTAELLHHIHTMLKDY